MVDLVKMIENDLDEEFVKVKEKEDIK